MLLTPHCKKQEDAIFADSKILALFTGIQFGKSLTGAVRMRHKMMMYTHKEDAFIIAAPTYKIMQQSTLPAFLKIMEGWGQYHKADAVFEMYRGGLCYMRTATEPDSIVGITNVRHIWVDEAGKVSLYFFHNVMARSAIRNCQIDLTTSPYALNWIYKDIVLPKLRDPTARPDVTLIQAASWENPMMPPDTIELARQTMDARRFNAVFGGSWEKMSGLVYDVFCSIENMVEHVDLEGAIFRAAIDWGYTDPFVLLIHAILPDGRRFQISETYKTQLTLPQIGEICLAKVRTWGRIIFYPDPSRPDSIAYLCSLGLICVAAQNDIRLGIDLVYEELKTRNLKFLKGTSPHTLDEMQTYHYPEPKDLKPDQSGKDEKPVGQFDHAMDCLRYLILMTRQAHVKLTPKTPGTNKRAATEAQKIAKLKKRR